MKKSKEQILEDEINSTRLVSQIKIENFTPTQYAIVMRAMETYAKQEAVSESNSESDVKESDFVKKATNVVEGWISNIRKKTEEVQKEVHDAIDEIESLIKKK